MINISTSSPVSWPTPPSTAVAPVAATPAIKPVQSGEQEAQPDVASRREARRQPKADEQTDPSLSLPGSPVSVVGDKAAVQARQDDAAQRAEQALKKAEADQASHGKAMDRLQEVLSNMWAASAAVVEQVLGLDPKGEAVPGSQSDTAPDLSAVAASTIQRRLLPNATGNAPAADQPTPGGMPWPVMPADTEESAATGAPEMPGGEVIAYDEHGNSSVAPLEAGTFLSEKV